jgi:hypothetical protein
MPPALVALEPPEPPMPAVLAPAPEVGPFDVEVVSSSSDFLPLAHARGRANRREHTESRHDMGRSISETVRMRNSELSY